VSDPNQLELFYVAAAGTGEKPKKKNGKKKERRLHHFPERTSAAIQFGEFS
jgi:hypothetical protein